jgi:hypothetical protein
MGEVPQPSEIYYRNLEDARRLKWQKVGAAGYVVHLGQPYIGASLNPRSGIWVLSRVQWCEEHNRFEYIQSVVPEGGYELHLYAPVEWVAVDELGVPPA